MIRPKWEQFQARYRKELREKQGDLDLLKQKAASTP